MYYSEEFLANIHNGSLYFSKTSAHNKKCLLQKKAYVYELRLCIKKDSVQYSVQNLFLLTSHHNNLFYMHITDYIMRRIQAYFKSIINEETI